MSYGEAILYPQVVVAPDRAAMSGVESGQTARTVRSWIRWITRANRGDYVIALCAASASTPVIGRHIQTIIAKTAPIGRQVPIFRLEPR